MNTHHVNMTHVCTSRARKPSHSFLLPPPVAQLDYRFYNIVTPLDAGTGEPPNVHILLEAGTSALTSRADIYCNPSWVTAQANNTPAEPGDSLFYTGARGVDLFAFSTPRKLRFARLWMMGSTKQLVSMW